MDSIQFLFDWAPKILFTVAFAWLGFIFFRKKIIEKKYSVFLIWLFFIERIVEIAARAIATYVTTKSFPSDSISAVLSKIQFLPSLEHVLFREGVVVLIGAIFWFLASIYAHRTHYEKIDQSDVNILTVGICIAGWPNFLAFLAIAFLFSLLGLLIGLLTKKAERMIVSPYLLLAVVVIIYFGSWLSRVTGLYAIR